MTLRSRPASSLDLACQRRAERVGESREQHAGVGRVCASRTARCSATTVLPVPAEPATRAGPRSPVSTISRWEGWRKTIHFSHGESSACAQFLDVLDDPEAPQSVGMARRDRRAGRRWLWQDGRWPRIAAAPRPPQPAGAARVRGRRLRSPRARRRASRPARRREKIVVATAWRTAAARRRALRNCGAGSSKRTAARSLRPARAPRRSGSRLSSDAPRSAAAPPRRRPLS